jgi:NADH-quinone oxidoreductase subunit J
MELILFYVLGGGALAFAAAMLLPNVGRNPIHSALSLVGTLFCLAGLYALLSAHLLSALQIIVYAGAVMVLFTFVIMLLNLQPDEIQPVRLTTLKVAAGIIGLFVFGKLITAITLAAGGAQSVDLTPHSAAIGGATWEGGFNGYGTIREVGRMLYTTFLVPFELVSVLLLVAAVGAVVLAKRSLHYIDAPTPPPAKLNRLANKPEAAATHDDHGHH